jgi:deoxyadenosine/deoxycytidine kinase
MSKLFVIEGNIGSGKSTLLGLLHNENISIIPEPLEIWKTIKTADGKNVLGHYYEDDKNTYLFQTIAGITRMELFQDIAGPIRISERSLYSDQIFGKVCLASGKMRDIEKECYTYFMNWLTKRFEPDIAGIIYLQCEPSICYDRILKRGRPEETGISYDYLQKLHESHEECILKKDNVLILNGNEACSAERDAKFKAMIYSFIGLQ